MVFKIVPMCNPDGVILGNHRTTLVGRDMNRQYAGFARKDQDNDQEEQEDRDQEDKLNPVPKAIKDLIGAYVKDDKDKILAFWDLHQHSHKKSIFIYGPYYPLHTEKYLKTRIIPRLLGERSEMFRYFSCRFRVDKYKEHCARITIGKVYNLVNSFTLECSSYGYLTKDRLTLQWKELDFIEFGKSICECMLEYYLLMERDKQLKQELKEKIIQRRKKRKPKMADIIKEFDLVKSKNSQVGLESAGLPSKKKELGAIDSNEEEESFSDLESDEVDSEEEEKPAEEKVKVLGRLKDGGDSPKKKRKVKREAEDNEESEEDNPDIFYSDDEEEGEEEDKKKKRSPSRPKKSKATEEDDEESEDEASSPMLKPSDIKGLLKLKQKRSKLDIKQYKGAKNDPKMKDKVRTLDDLLTMIKSDIIHEEQDEADSNKTLTSISS
mmetsp:Transcript_35080/g.34102  ORF Transcript_35080/g.34102 Transcript_35080/m.34102 type:complete len:437 (+) Transcript_35080:907-2217(+)